MGLKNMASGGTQQHEYIRADLAAPSAPAEVEGLVADLLKADRGYEPGTMFTEAATALTALQAENERLRYERDRNQASRQYHIKRRKEAVARAEKAEAERDAWKSNAEALAEAVSPFADVGVPSDPMSRINLTADREFVIAAREALAAHAKLKGDV